MSDPISVEGFENEVISEEDRSEILSEIEKIAAENKIDVSLDHLEYTPQKNGALFPIMANLGGVLLLGAGLFLLFTLFENESATIRETATPVTATESRLVAELQREAEEQLAAKEAEIDAINARLETIDAEREALASDIDAQIAQREAELEEQFQAELEAERRRLRTLNLTDAEFEARLAEFEAEKRQEYDARLDAVRERLLAERDRLEDDLDQLESQFTRTLTEANREREAIIQESEARLSELRSDFESRLEQTEAERTAAEEELRQLNRTRDRELLIRGQITGLYGEIQDSLEAEQYDEALSQVAGLRALLQEPSTLQIEALREERNANLFMLRTLESHIQTVREQQSSETLSRLSDAALVQRVAELEEQAAQAVRAGNSELAETLYQQAIGTIPEISSSFAYLAGVDNDGDPEVTEAQLQAAEELVAGGEANLLAGDYQSGLESFLEVLALYAATPFRGRALTGVEESFAGAVATVQDEIAEFEAAMEDATLEAVAAEQAYESEIADLQAELVAQEAENEAFQSAITRLETQLETVREQRTALEAQRDSLSGQLETARSRSDAQQERVEALESRISSLDQEVLRLEGSLTDGNRALAESRRRVAELETTLAETLERTETGREMVEELAELRSMEEQLSLAEELYAAYRAEASVVGAGATGVEVVETKLLLDEFLGSGALTGFFPGLLQEVRKYESVYQESGRENAMVDVADAIFEVSTEDGNGARLSRVRELRTASDNQLMRDFLSELELLLSE